MRSLDSGNTVLDLCEFGIDPVTGFLPRRTPLRRLPAQWEPWEAVLDAARGRVKLGAIPGLGEAERKEGEVWRERVRQLGVLSTAELEVSEELLRRAHHVLTYILHFYVHSLPPQEAIRIPSALGLPLLRVSAVLDLPPTMSYSDDVLYNWKVDEEDVPTVDTLRCQTSFTGSPDEEGFYLSASRVELRGGAVMALVQIVLNELSILPPAPSPIPAATAKHVTTSLTQIATIITQLKGLLLGVRDTCNPEYFFREVRPWLIGTEPGQEPAGRAWVFEGLKEAGLEAPMELSGSSAAQSTFIQVLDTFLGVDVYAQGENAGKMAAHHGNVMPFVQRMRLYMPRQHRAFLTQLAKTRPLREIVTRSDDAELLGAYNAAVGALKEFRDAHMIIVTLYIIGPGRRAAREAAEAGIKGEAPLKGSAGGDLARLLKDFRDRTTGAVIPDSDHDL